MMGQMQRRSGGERYSEEASLAGKLEGEEGKGRGHAERER